MKLASFLKKYEGSDKGREVKVDDHSNPHVLQVIKTLKKPKEDRQTNELRILEEEIESLDFF